MVGTGKTGEESKCLSNAKRLKVRVYGKSRRGIRDTLGFKSTRKSQSRSLRTYHPMRSSNNNEVEYAEKRGERSRHDPNNRVRGPPWEEGFDRLVTS